MYFNKKNSFMHGIMFHHFHDNIKHNSTQGSIDQDKFYKLLRFIGKKNILNPDSFINKILNNQKESKSICLTFDDGIKSQIDVALPVLQDLKIKAFFFIYSSPFEGKSDKLEIYRYFRHSYFNNIDNFYTSFFKYINLDLKKYFRFKEKKILHFKKISPHYTFNDIKFRLIRDEFLNRNDYEKIMHRMFQEKKFNPKKIEKKLYFGLSDIKTLTNSGHTIGLHTHSHPTNIKLLNYKKQKEEYSKCLNILSKKLNIKKNILNSMSHPCGSYNNDTIKILKKLKIKIGFDQNMLKLKKRNFNLLIPRVDHADLIKLIS
jgi:peptidoglycan/xylan/chitin deacetylase (PgdA/CDA1 family)